jgi:hypothetical protein
MVSRKDKSTMSNDEQDITIKDIFARLAVVMVATTLVVLMMWGLVVIVIWLFDFATTCSDQAVWLFTAGGIGYCIDPLNVSITLLVLVALCVVFGALAITLEGIIKR